jgi:C4-dicarboxylate-specific signal transduction histidine kinase
VQMQLAHANRVAAIGQLTASIAHELKQPLSAVVSNGGVTLRWLTRNQPEIGEAKQTVECIIKDANRATEVLDRIHRLVKKESLRTDTLNINDAILEVIPLIHSEAVKNGVTVQRQLADQLPNIEGDRVQLQQVMLNLIINAIQAMSGLAEGLRELHIVTESAEGIGVRIAVRDTGPGLSAENIHRLFEPFYTTKPNGMGMGLSICRSIIEDHGGRLWATGLHPHGALFQFTIPAC